MIRRIDDDLLDRLGNFFVHMEIQKRLGITFAMFLHLYDTGTWKDWI